ncbi:hypothetical protein BJ912DRAFT_1082212 [Pholiota molesta]|nr:hypothetical protein BJ912DRAFT_1082212 [Pholiota molesta]
MGALWRGSPRHCVCARGWVAATATGGGWVGDVRRGLNAGLEGIIYGPPTPPPAKRSPIGNRNRNLHIALRPNGESPRTLGSGTEGGPTTHLRLVRLPDLEIGGREARTNRNQQPSLASLPLCSFTHAHTRAHTAHGCPAGQPPPSADGRQLTPLPLDPWIESQTDPSAPAPEADDTAHVAPGWQTDCSLACPV